MDKRTFSYLFVGFFLLLTIYLFFNNDSIATTIVNDGATGVFWYILSHPEYILLFFALVFISQSSNKIKEIIGALSIILAIDIVSFPRFSPLGISNDMAFLASTDGIFMNKLLSLGMAYSTAYTIFYLIIPIVLILFALYLFGYAEFFKRLVGR